MRGLWKIMLSGMIAAMAVTLFSWRIAPRRLETVRLRIRVPALPQVWEGVRIAHLSDFHVGGPGVSLPMLHDARQIAESFEPDVIALTGDFFNDGQWVETKGLFERWPDNVPVVAVLGNHDDRGGRAHVRRLLDLLERENVRVLRNEAVEIVIRGKPAWIVGVDDPYAWRMDDRRAFSAVPDSSDALLYLAHSPAAAITMPVGRARLVLSGHTHGGQIRVLPSGRIPFVTPIRRIKGAPVRNDPPFFRGVHWYRGAVIVISNGLGVSQIPLRFLARPHVVLIEVTRAEADGSPCDDVSRYVTRVG